MSTNDAVAAGTDPAVTGDVTVLCLDDDEAVLDLLVAFLSREGPFDVHTTTDPATAVQAVSRGRVHLVVSDYEMGPTTGLEFLERVGTHDGDLPFVLFTSHGTSELAATARAAGVTRFVRKGGPTGSLIWPTAWSTRSTPRTPSEEHQTVTPARRGRSRRNGSRVPWASRSREPTCF